MRCAWSGRLNQGVQLLLVVTYQICSAPQLASASLLQLANAHERIPIFRVGAICVPHVRGRLDARDELENDVANADDTNDHACYPLPPEVANDEGADEDVDCGELAMLLTYSRCSTHRFLDR